MKPVENDMFLQYLYPNNLRYNPSESAAAFILTQPDAGSDSYLNRLCIYENGVVQTAFTVGANTNYIWQDDENILFLNSGRQDYTEIFKGNVHTGKITKLCDYRLNIREIACIGSHSLAAICLTDINCPELWAMPETEALAVMAQRETQAERCTVLDELPYFKNGIHDFINKRRNTVFIIDLESKRCRRVTDTFFQTENYCIDADTIFFNGSAYDKKMCLFQEIWCYRLGDEKPRCLYNGHKYNMRGLYVWDGQLMMFGNTNPNIKLFHTEFYTVDRETGDISCFCAYDKSIHSYVTGDGAYGKAKLCRACGDKLYFVSTIDNASWLMSINKSGKVEPVIKHEGAFCDFDISGGRVLFTALWDNRPLEIYETALDTPEEYRPVSCFNDVLLSECYVAQPRKLSFMFKKWRIDGWALLPIDYDPGKSYPALLNIHGGPNAVYSEAYSHEMQVWASKGFFVLFCNPVGSEGRGDEFMDIHGNFGGEDYECIMDFTDRMLEEYPQIDRKRLCVTGGSYGGFMTNWIITHTNRFSAAATQRSISNWVTTALLCDNGWYNMPPQMRGDIYSGADKLWEQSPLKYIANAVTPTLILHSEQDYSVPIEEGMQLYSALIGNGIETRMVRFKGETHELSRSGRPLSRIRRIDEITQWMLKHIKTERS